MRGAGTELAAEAGPVLAKHASIVPTLHAETFAHLVREAGAPEGTWTNLFGLLGIRWRNIIADPRAEPRRADRI